MDHLEEMTCHLYSRHIDFSQEAQTYEIRNLQETIAFLIFSSLLFDQKIKELVVLYNNLGAIFVSEDRYAVGICGKLQIWFFTNAPISICWTALIASQILSNDNDVWLSLIGILMQEQHLCKKCCRFSTNKPFEKAEF
ncbi:hypothetical protein ACJX0J_035138, partial [Zea mays]